VLPIHILESHGDKVTIFLVTYLLTAVESGRGSHLDRTAAAFCGAVAMVLVGVVPLPQAYEAIDWNTLIFFCWE
jgi:di/tricarboxylate transporter